jgi:hypothetical protein
MAYSYDRRVAHAKNLVNIVAEIAEQGFVEAFFRKHPVMRRFTPKAVIEKDGSGPGPHPEARQHGDEVWLFPKFWKLDKKTQEFVFAHELGHYALSNYGLSAFVKLAEANGIDVWDVPSLPFGQFNMEEAFADAFATYFLGGPELDNRYPKWTSIVGAVVAGRRVP